MASSTPSSGSSAGGRVRSWSFAGRQGRSSTSRGLARWGRSFTFRAWPTVTRFSVGSPRPAPSLNASDRCRSFAVPFVPRWVPEIACHQSQPLPSFSVTSQSRSIRLILVRRWCPMSRFSPFAVPSRLRSTVEVRTGSGGVRTAPDPWEACRYPNPGQAWWVSGVPCGADLPVENRSIRLTPSIAWRILGRASIQSPSLAVAVTTLVPPTTPSDRSVASAPCLVDAWVATPPLPNLVADPDSFSDPS